ncbi:MoaD/ThiS family protein [Rhodospirillaceae bacterium KN72]|uniref:MoaD/ThiS family protein n=1 Tax=Pacificispira spongiicola TaxID=2729598 RepID=A0A7Y0E1P4_9PROT|nr:MoaD/ThiS family protein [Pacificispira spongiicola]NMM45610.1 MoaD/ThiS family protein [Pacificispira spongiicola]
MAKVVLWGSLSRLADGRKEFDIDAPDIGRMLAALGSEAPKLKPILDKGVTVSIDGTLYRLDRFKTIDPDSEVFILPKMAGG